MYCIERRKWVIPCEITHSKNLSLPIVFILSTQCVYPMKVLNPEYQPPVTSGSRVTVCDFKWNDPKREKDGQYIRE